MCSIQNYQLFQIDFGICRRFMSRRFEEFTSRKSATYILVYALSRVNNAYKQETLFLYWKLLANCADHIVKDSTKGKCRCQQSCDTVPSIRLK